MRLKAIPEDFVVREATDLRIRKQPGPYRVYMLEKKDWNTADALMRIAKEKRIPYDRIAYGGKKDRHAHTYQYITVEQHPADLSLTAKGYSLKMMGFSTEPMGPSRILSNHFDLTVRELSDGEVRQLQANLGAVKERGIPNYFDDQRFGNLDPERGYIAEKMLQGRWEDALAIALTAIYPEEKRDAKERKRALRERWGDWAACRELAVTALEQRAFDLLTTRPGSFREALETVHKETTGMWVSTYQSFLWNEVLRRYIALRGWAGASVAGAAGPYVFTGPEANLGEMIIPLPGQGMRFPVAETGEIFEELLAERRLRPAVLEREVMKGVGFRASPRPALALPTGLHLEGPLPDERYPGTSKVMLRFSLQRGSYATMLVKSLFS